MLAAAEAALSESGTGARSVNEDRGHRASRAAASPQSVAKVGKSTPFRNVVTGEVAKPDGGPLFVEVKRCQAGCSIPSSSHLKRCVRHGLLLRW
jgi:hypothetical protein